MKSKRRNALHVFLITLLCATVAISCKKNDNGGGGGDAASGTIKATVSGKSFTSLKQTTAGQRLNVAGTTMITFQGSTTSGTALVFTLNGVTETGTFAIGGGANISIGVGYTEVNITNPAATQTWQAPYDNTVSGEIKIAEISDRGIKGTFECKAQNTGGDKSFRDIKGSFNVNF